jgi:hypothetical protein
LKNVARSRGVLHRRAVRAPFSSRRAEASRGLIVGSALALLMIGALVIWWRSARVERTRSVGRTPEKNAAVTAPAAHPIPEPKRARPPETANRPLSAAEKAARVEKIKRDYDEIRTKASADFSAAGTNFPGGLNAFLRQLALLEREKRADLAAVLSAAELEDLEMRETTAGQLVQKWLGDTAASEAQRREVFRLQRAFEEKFALTFDLTPGALLARETSRQQLQEQIRGVLGDALFASWLRAEGGDFAQFQKFAAQQGLPADAPLNLWRAKNEFTRQRLELNARGTDRRNEQFRAAQAALTQEIEARVLGIVGPGAMTAARNEVLAWLPRR